MRLVPYYDGEWREPSTDNVAYIRVRVTKEPRANGFVTVYLADGTALDVRADNLVRVETRVRA